MSDDVSLSDFEAYLIQRGYNWEKRQEIGLIIYIVPDYKVLHGKYSEQRIRIAFPLPQDYPSTAPYGIHVQSNLDLGPGRNGSILGQEWSLWSRKMDSWLQGRRTSQHYVDLVNRWLEGGA